METASALLVELKQIDGFEFTADYKLEDVPVLHVDEPAPLGKTHGPNPSRLLATAIASCLASSLLFCLRKSRIEPEKIEAQVTGSMMRNERNRLRIANMHVNIDLFGLTEYVERMRRCLEIFEDFCVVTATVRQGMVVTLSVKVDGREVYSTV